MSKEALRETEKSAIFWSARIEPRRNRVPAVVHKEGLVDATMGSSERHGLCVCESGLTEKRVVRG